jgi:hypothetical protein
MTRSAPGGSGQVCSRPSSSLARPARGRVGRRMKQVRPSASTSAAVAPEIPSRCRTSSSRVSRRHSLVSRSWAVRSSTLGRGGPFVKTRRAARSAWRVMSRSGSSAVALLVAGVVVGGASVSSASAGPCGTAGVYALQGNTSARSPDLQRLTQRAASALRARVTHGVAVSRSSVASACLSSEPSPPA